MEGVWGSIPHSSTNKPQVARPGVDGGVSWLRSDQFGLPAYLAGQRHQAMLEVINNRATVTDVVTDEHPGLGCR